MSTVFAKRLSSLSARPALWVAAGGAALSALWYFGERVKLPEGVTPIAEFDIDRYLGHWYEVARIDQRFERGLESCTAHYQRLEDGSVQVTNRGRNPETGEWDEATAIAKFTGDPSVGALKVAFFRPFYGGYNVVYVDEQYEHAVVVGDSTNYFWILARWPHISDAKYQELLKIAAENGVDPEQVVRIPQDGRDQPA